MTEFDFDELDRAVNSLMQKTPQQDESSARTETTPASATRLAPKGEPQAPAAPATSHQAAPSSAQPKPTSPAPAKTAPVQASPTVPTSDVAKPAVTAPAAPAASSTKPAPSSPAVSSRPTAPVTNGREATPSRRSSTVAKKRGNFMDVVHPSSDMRPRQPATRPVSREGATIAPAEQEPATAPASMTSQPQASRTTVSAAPSAPPATDIAKPAPPSPRPTTPVKPRQPSDVTLSDTLSNAAAETTKAPAPNETTSPAVVTPPQGVQSAGGSDAQPNAENESLFIPDAKVEKRPLGATGNPEATIASTPQNIGNSEPEATTKPSLPDELSKKMMNIENEGTIKPTPAPAPNPQAATKPATPATSTSTPAAPTAGPTGSIPQQYQRKFNEDDEDHPAIYDPAYYKQEMQTKPEKKKSGWWVVFAIIGFIVVGGAGGVLYYFYSTGAF